jgi:hypothetical protein
LSTYGAGELVITMHLRQYLYLYTSKARKLSTYGAGDLVIAHHEVGEG